MTKNRLSHNIPPKNKTGFSAPAGKRIPVCFCIDTSLSMNLIIDDKNSQSVHQTVTIEGQKGQLVTGGTSIKNCLNQQLETFYRQFNKEVSRNSGIEIALVTFDEIARISQDFTTFRQIEKLPTIQTKGLESNLAEGLETALDLLDRRKRYYLDEELSYYHPFLIVMTDGQINRNDPYFQRIKEQIVSQTEQAKMNLIICSFTKEVAPALLDLQEGNVRLKERKQGYYGNEIYHLDSTENIANFFHYMTVTLQEGEDRIWH